MNILSGFKNIKAFVFDVDGVLTDGFIYLMKEGEQVRKMNIKDGYALQLAVKKDFQVAVISGANEEGVYKRLVKLGIRDIYLGESDKKGRLQSLIDRWGIPKDQLLFMGDDMPDYEAMDLAGLPTCPVDAVEEIREKAIYISPVKGGYGCVRDVIEKVLKLNDCWLPDSEIKAI